MRLGDARPWRGQRRGVAARGWIVVDMARDWLRVYPDPPQSP